MTIFTTASSLVTPLTGLCRPGCSRKVTGSVSWACPTFIIFKGFNIDCNKRRINPRQIAPNLPGFVHRIFTGDRLRPDDGGFADNVDAWDGGR